MQYVLVVNVASAGPSVSIDIDLISSVTNLVENVRTNHFQCTN